MDVGASSLYRFETATLRPMTWTLASTRKMIAPLNGPVWMFPRFTRPVTTPTATFETTFTDTVAAAELVRSAKATPEPNTKANRIANKLFAFIVTLLSRQFFFPLTTAHGPITILWCLSASHPPAAREGEQARHALGARCMLLSARRDPRTNALCVRKLPASRTAFRLQGVSRDAHEVPGRRNTHLTPQGLPWETAPGAATNVNVCVS